MILVGSRLVYTYGHHRHLHSFPTRRSSDLNEALLADYMYENLDDTKKKLYLLNEQLEGFRGTVFRQTMFAEFEHEIHRLDRKSTRLNSSHVAISYAVFCLKKKIGTIAEREI